MDERERESHAKRRNVLLEADIWELFRWPAQPRSCGHRSMEPAPIHSGGEDTHGRGRCEEALPGRSCTDGNDCDIQARRSDTIKSKSSRSKEMNKMVLYYKSQTDDLLEESDQTESSRI